MLAKLVKEQRQDFVYAMKTNHVGAAGLDDFVSTSLITPSIWTSKFNTPIEATTAYRKWVYGPIGYLESIRTQCEIAMERSGTITVGRPVNFAIFWVTLKAANAENTLDRTGDLTSMTKGTDYAATDGVDGVPQFWSLNPELYTIKAKREGKIGTHVTAYAEHDGEATVNNLGDVYKRFDVSFPMKVQLGNGGVTSSQPTWRETPKGKIRNTNRVYMVSFTNAAPGQVISFVSQHEFSGYEPI